MNSKLNNSISSLTNLLTKDVVLQRVLLWEYYLLLVLVFLLNFFGRLFIGLLCINLQGYKWLLLVSIVYHLLPVRLGGCLYVTSVRLLNFTFEKCILRVVHMLISLIWLGRDHSCLDKVIVGFRLCYNLLIFGIIKVKAFTYSILGGARVDEPPLLRAWHPNRLWMND